MEKNVAADFDPNAPGINNGCYFGLPFTPEEAQLVLLPVPWEVTASYGGGTASAPDAILDASMQVDLYDIHYPGGWERGIGTLEMDDTLQPRSARLRQEALRVMSHLEGGGSPESELMQRRLRRINEASAELNDYVYGEAKRWLDAGKKVGVVGGDHSVPLGLIRAVAGRYPGIGILHVDAHADLREAYEGFTYSHASIMYNALHEARASGRWCRWAYAIFATRSWRWPVPTKGWCSSPTTSWRRRSSKVRRGARYATGSLQRCRGRFMSASISTG